MKKSILALTAFFALVPAAAMAQYPVRVGGSVQAPERIKYVPPVYPGLAQAARVSGIVILEAVVGTDGSVSDVKVLKSIPVLDDAAVEAARQWRYTPTTLNGVPVPVIMTVTVNFTLSDGAASTNGQRVQGSMQSVDMRSELPSEWNGKPAVRIGGTIKAPERIKYVAPNYPEVARAENVSGIVIVEAIVDEDGNVGTAKVLKSIPLLDQAALDAVMQWKYVPTLLNGVAVPVVMTITVNFTIGGN